jgi:GNAT superfamily N-acetyltransferase
VRIDLAGPQDLTQLARLLWAHAAPDEQATQSVESFSADLETWWAHHHVSHLAFVARQVECDGKCDGKCDGESGAESGGESGVVGMAWLALLPRVPRPGTTARLSADVQSVFVEPEHRGQGIGSALVQAASEHAARLGAGRVTVHSGRRAVPVYERLGFASSRQLLQWPPD